MRVFGLIGILITVAIIAFLATKSLGSLSSNGDIKAPVKAAATLKEQTDLISLETKLDTFFLENGRYPNSLTEIDSYGVAVENFQYTVCSPTSVLLVTSSGSKKALLRSGSVTQEESC